MLIRQYVLLQFRLINRHLVEFGIRPFWGYLLPAIGFTGLSLALFKQTVYAGYLYVFVALVTMQAFQSENRIDFLKNCFSKKDYLLIRRTEMALVALPFLLFLWFKGAYLLGLSLLLIVLLSSSAGSYRKINLRISTPFYRHPFEFAMGFRNSYLMVVPAYLLSYMAIVAGNFNLGLFATGSLYFIGLTYYSAPEPFYYVWIFNCSEKGFLWYKIKTALIYSFVMALPAGLPLGLAFPDQVLTLIGIVVFGSLVLVAALLGKYAAYPSEINIIQALGLAACIIFPPMLLLILPLFYLKALKQLNPVLK